jgi:hypothetical protein
VIFHSYVSLPEGIRRILKPRNGIGFQIVRQQIGGFVEPENHRAIY